VAIASIRDLLARLDGTEGLPLTEIVAASRRVLVATTSPVTVRPIEETVNLVLLARRLAIPCAIASSAARELVRTGLAVLGLERHFEAVVTREDVPRGHANRRDPGPPRRWLR
jgi:beta-phosphoglucomutase-like phosphatase (HAD superfamily)